MASGPGEGSVQGQRFAENKVYTRKPKGTKLPPANPNPNPPPAVPVANDVSTTHLEPVPVVKPVIEPIQPVRVSDDESSSLKRGAAHSEGPNGVSRSVSINISTRSRQELRDLKRRLTSELDQVRSLSKRLDVAASAAATSAPPAPLSPPKIPVAVPATSAPAPIPPLPTPTPAPVAAQEEAATSAPAPVAEQVEAAVSALPPMAAREEAATSAATPVAAPEHVALPEYATTQVAAHEEAATPVAAAGYTQSQFSATDPETPATLHQPVFSKRTITVTTTPLTVPPPKIPAPYRRQLSVSLSDNLPTESLEKRTPKANQLYNNSDFLLAKDRIPPPELFKKSKSNGSKKHSLSDLDQNEKKVYSNAFKKCASLLAKLMKHRFGWVFNKPVDPVALQLHDYFTIITHPMDLGTIKTRLSKNWYKSPREYAEDVRLTFNNAMVYNPKGQDVHLMAEQLLQIFEEGWSAIDADLSYQLAVPPIKKAALLERSDSTLNPKPVPTPTPVPVPAPVQYITRTPALKKPKAKDLNKRDMTFEEKRRLSNNLQNLPQDKLDIVVQIIKRKNLSMSQHDDEIEVDIDSMDVETLWELDRFVMNYKKNLSKHKRKAELAMLKRGIDQNAPRVVRDDFVRVQETNAAGEAPNRGNEAPVEDGKNASRSSSTSSSSSSGSSSSDSDSDSSSASDAPQ